MTQVTVLCGFLGAGKTTTLSHVLQHACPVGERVGVIANDVAAVNIDAQLVREVARASDGRATSVALDNGCACCTGSADLVSGFEQLLSEDAARAAAGAEPGRTARAFEHVVIETTGVAEAGQMRTVCGAFPSVKAGRARLAAVVTVVDAGDFLTHCRSGDLLRQRPDLCGEETKEGGSRMIVDLLMEQVEHADAILLNKMDQLEGDARRANALRAVIAELNPKAKIYSASFGRVDLLRIGAELAAGSRAASASAATPAGLPRGAPSLIPLHQEQQGQHTLCEGKVHEQHGECSNECGSHQHVEHCDDCGCSHERACVQSHCKSHSQCESDSHCESQSHCCESHSHCDSGACVAKHGHACAGLVSHSDRYGLSSFVFKSDKPFNGPRLSQSVLQKMAAVQRSAAFPALDILEQGLAPRQQQPEQEHQQQLASNPFKNVVRSKGFLFLAGPHRGKKMYWSHAGRHFGVLPKDDWDDERPRQELVFIGVDMDQAAIVNLLESALQQP